MPRRVGRSGRGYSNIVVHNVIIREVAIQISSYGIDCFGVFHGHSLRLGPHLADQM